MHSKGNISMNVLIGSLFLVAFVQIILNFSIHSKISILEELEDYQLRKLCGSLVEALENNTYVDGSETCSEIILEPGHHQVNIIRSSEKSDDSLLSYATIGAVADNQRAFYMHKLTVNLPSIIKEKIKDSPIIYKNSIIGTEYLNKGTTYTSIQEEVMPKFKFLNGKALDTLTSDIAIQDGFSSRFYYLPSSNTFSFNANSNIRGSTVFVNNGNINIANSCVFHDRVMLISNAGNITIGKNTNFKKALIMSHGTVTIDSDSKINGLIIGSQIILKGPVSLSQDEEVVTPFSSAYFLNTLS